MSNDKYIGLDVHQSSVVAAVHNHQGKCVMESIIETKAQTIRDFIKSISGTVHVAFEEGAQAAWLYDLIRPLVSEVRIRRIGEYGRLDPRETASMSSYSSDMW